MVIFVLLNLVLVLALISKKSSDIDSQKLFVPVDVSAGTSQAIAGKNGGYFQLVQ